MSQSSTEPVRVLVASQSVNRAEEILNLLRSASMPARTQHIDSADALSKALSATPAWDLLVLEPLDSLSLENALKLIDQASAILPVIQQAGEGDVDAITQGLEAGAQDVVLDGQSQRLQLIIGREFSRVTQARQVAALQASLEEAEQRNELLLQGSTVAIAYVHEGMHIYANQPYIDLFGFEDEDDLAGIPLLDVVAESHHDAIRDLLREFNDSDISESAPAEFTGVSQDGAAISAVLNLSRAAYEGEDCTQLLLRTDAAVAPAVGEETASPTPASPVGAEVLAEGIVGHRATAISRVHAMYAQETEFLALHVVVNEFHSARRDVGVGAESALVDQTNLVLRDRCGEEDELYAFCDGEFLILRSNESDLERGTEKAHAIRQHIEEAVLEANERSFDVTASIGVAASTQCEDTESLFRAVQAASSNANNNEVLCYEPPRDLSGSGEEAGGQELTDEIQRRIEENEFTLYYQPIISLRGDTDEHYEVYLRMPKEDGTLALPGEFIDPAVNAGLGSQLDRWVILQSIKVLSTHRAKGNDTRLTINLTSASLLDDTFLSWLSVAIKAARLPTDAAIFQISETDAASYLKQAKEFCAGMKELHCRTSLSHFGLSLNPFGTLRHLSVDFVKLDGTLIEELDTNQRARESLANMINSLQTQGKLTVVPMVESASMLSSLWQAGANYIQGNYLQEPSQDMDYEFDADD